MSFLKLEFPKRGFPGPGGVRKQRVIDGMIAARARLSVAAVITDLPAELSFPRNDTGVHCRRHYRTVSLRDNTAPDSASP